MDYSDQDSRQYVIMYNTSILLVIVYGLEAVAANIGLREVNIGLDTSMPRVYTGSVRELLSTDEWRWNMRWDLATRYQILLDINNAVITETSKDKFFNTLLGELKKHFAFDGATILLYDEKSEYLDLFASAGANIEEVLYLKHRPLSMGYLAKKVILSRKPVSIEDLRPYQHEFPVGELLKLGISATIAFPLVVHDRVTGSLHFLFKTAPAYMPELFEFLTHVSKQVAIAVDVFLSYARVKEANLMLEEEKKFLLDQSNGCSDGDIIYASTAMKRVIANTRQAAHTDASILITGETGTGKDKIARFVHDLSPRKNHLFVKVNCPAIAETLFESELFGHSKGAFTGAVSKRVGRIEMAHRGTLFLDEISEIPMNLQAKLLQVLQDMQFERLGDSNPIRVNFRVIAATNENLEKRIREGFFRKDLYYRLNIINIHVPPLRERKEDIPLLIRQLNRQEALEIKKPPPRYSDEALEYLCNYDWPGNVRELKNLISRMVILHPDKQITCRELSSSMQPDFLHESKAPTTLDEIERHYIEQALIRCRGVVGGPDGAAKLLGMPRSTLKYQIKKHSLSPKAFA